MLLRTRSLAFLFAMFAATSGAALGCSSSDSSGDEDEGALVDEAPTSGWTVDIAKVRTAFPNGAAEFPIENAQDLFRVLVDLGPGKPQIKANTHLFTKIPNIIPYANQDVEATAAAAAGGRGDSVIGEYIKPGEVGLMIKHHRGEHRVLKMGGAGEEMKEQFKLQDTHIGLIVGIERDGKAGAISINNPKGYEGGQFGNDHYQMIFVKPTFPAGISAAQQKAYSENIRAMAVLFNTVSTFPGDYNGGDPLAAHSPDEVRMHVGMMVKAIGGDPEAQEWFTEAANKIYCAELAFVAMSAGILVPLNRANIVGLPAKSGQVTAEDYDKFVAAVGTAWPFAGDISKFTVDTTPSNDKLKFLKSYPPNFNNDLAPISTLAAAPKRADGVPGKGLAFEPMTMADMVQHFLRTHVPRDPTSQTDEPLVQGGRPIGEGVAEMQAAVYAGMEEGLMKRMGFENPADPQRQRSITSAEALAQLPGRIGQGERVAFTVKDVFDGIATVVAKNHGTYENFQRAVQPWMAVARKVTGPKRSDSGEGLFAPPSLYHVIAQDQHPGGYLGLKYLGHGVHFSHVKAPSSPSTPAAPAGGGGGGATPNGQSQDKAPSGPPANPMGDP